MDRKEKNRMKAEIGEYIDLSNGRYTDKEIERLHSLVQNREQYNGRSKTYPKEYKSFDRSDTYRVEEKDIFTIRSDDAGIRIEEKVIKDWDDGQHDEWSTEYNTGRQILRALGLVLRK